MNKFLFLICCIFVIGFTSCADDPSDTDNNNNNIDGPALRFKFNFDELQERLNNIGLPATIPAGNAAQTPDFNSMSIHYIELAPSAFTALGTGTIVYKGEETNQGGNEAVDFRVANVADENEVFFSISLKDVAAGEYEWIRTSVTYQNYDITFNLVGPSASNLDLCDGGPTGRTGTVASFLGYNVYISSITPKEESLAVNDDKLQGFWVFERDDLGSVCEGFLQSVGQGSKITSGEAPAGSTTVVNPLFDSSPIPAGSCVVTAPFTNKLTITGNETEDIVVTLSYSVNNSLEWVDNIPNGELDFHIDNPASSDRIVDMGVRGLIPSWE